MDDEGILRLEQEDAESPLFIYPLEPSAPIETGSDHQSGQVGRQDSAQSQSDQSQSPGRSDRTGPGSVHAGGSARSPPAKRSASETADSPAKRRAPQQPASETDSDAGEEAEQTSDSSAAEEPPGARIAAKRAPRASRPSTPSLTYSEFEADVAARSTADRKGLKPRKGGLKPRKGPRGRKQV